MSKLFSNHTPIPAFLWENVPKPSVLSPLVHLLCMPHSEDGQDHSVTKFFREFVSPKWDTLGYMSTLANDES